MWIKEPSLVLQKSLNDNVNFLFQSSNIYIMDNHLAAAWCWINEQVYSKLINLIHIDYHYDLLDCPLDVSEVFVSRDPGKLTFSEYESLSRPYHDSTKLFLWDNYILNFQMLFPGVFGQKVFATKEDDGHVPEHFITEEVDHHNLLLT